MSGRVITAAFAGFVLIGRRPAAAAVWMGLLTLFSLATFALQTWMITGARSGTGHFPGVFSAQVWPIFLALFLVGVLLQLAVTGAINRAILRPSASGFAYLRMGRDELNLLGVGMIFVLALLVYGVAISVMRIVGFSPLLIVLLALLLALALWPRLTLLAATAIGRGRFGFSEAWDLGGEHYWSLLAMCVVNLIVAGLLFGVQVMILRLMPHAADMPLRLAAYLPAGAVGSLITVIMYAPAAEALLVLKARPVDQAAAFD
jgi:hypothetical protein